MFRIDLMEGRSIFFASRLPAIITMIPASENRSPAKRIWVAVESAGMLNNPYPIFMQGKALPQRAQQIVAMMIMKGVLVQIFFFASDSMFFSK